MDHLTSDTSYNSAQSDMFGLDQAFGRNERDYYCALELPERAVRLNCDRTKQIGERGRCRVSLGRGDSAGFCSLLCLCCPPNEANTIPLRIPLGPYVVLPGMWRVDDTPLAESSALGAITSTITITIMVSLFAPAGLIAGRTGHQRRRGSSRRPR